MERLIWIAIAGIILQLWSLPARAQNLPLQFNANVPGVESEPGTLQPMSFVHPRVPGGLIFFHETAEPTAQYARTLPNQEASMYSQITAGPTGDVAELIWWDTFTDDCNGPAVPWCAASIGRDDSVNFGYRGIQYEADPELTHRVHFKDALTGAWNSRIRDGWVAVQNTGEPNGCRRIISAADGYIEIPECIFANATNEWEIQLDDLSLLLPTQCSGGPCYPPLWDVYILVWWQVWVTQ